MPGPLATMRGPTRNPSLMASRRSTARKGRDPTSRTVVKPASSVVRAFFTAGKRAVIRRVLEFVDVVEPVSPSSKCVWQSIRPGRTVASDRSTVVAPSGIEDDPARLDRRDAFPLDLDHDIALVGIAGAVEEPARRDVYRCRSVGGDRMEGEQPRDAQGQDAGHGEEITIQGVRPPRAIRHSRGKNRHLPLRALPVGFAPARNRAELPSL